MFGCLIDELDTGKWKEIGVAQKNAGKFKTYHVMRNHKALSDTEMSYMVAEEDGDPKTVTLKDCQCKKDPLKQIGQIELQLNDEETEIVGIDLNDEVVVRQ